MIYILFYFFQITEYSSHQHSAVEMAKSSSLPPECAPIRSIAISDGHSTDTSSASERLFGMPSEGILNNVTISLTCLYFRLAYLSSNNFICHTYTSKLTHRHHVKNESVSQK